MQDFEAVDVARNNFQRIKVRHGVTQLDDQVMIGDRASRATGMPWR